jgi:hypothetical protein
VANDRKRGAFAALDFGGAGPVGSAEIGVAGTSRFATNKPEWTRINPNASQFWAITNPTKPNFEGLPGFDQLSWNDWFGSFHQALTIGFGRDIRVFSLLDLPCDAWTARPGLGFQRQSRSPWYRRRVSSERRAAIHHGAIRRGVDPNVALPLLHRFLTGENGALITDGQRVFLRVSRFEACSPDFGIRNSGLYRLLKYPATLMMVFISCVPSQSGPFQGSPYAS